MAGTADRVMVQTVHPHGRGDNMTDILNAATSVGSPPRAWGQFPVLPLKTILRRFTPTGVGTILASQAF